MPDSHPTTFASRPRMDNETGVRERILRHTDIVLDTKWNAGRAGGRPRMDNEISMGPGVKLSLTVDQLRELAGEFGMLAGYLSAEIDNQHSLAIDTRGW